MSPPGRYISKLSSTSVFAPWARHHTLAFLGVLFGGPRSYTALILSTAIVKWALKLLTFLAVVLRRALPKFGSGSEAGTTVSRGLSVASVKN